MAEENEHYFEALDNEWDIEDISDENKPLTRRKALKDDDSDIFEMLDRHDWND